jgi:hypothetical protein
MSDDSVTVSRCWLGFAGFYACSFAVLGVYMQFLPDLAPEKWTPRLES